MRNGLIYSILFLVVGSPEIGQAQTVVPLKNITQYQVYFGRLNEDPNSQILVIRKFVANDKVFFLTINSETLKTQVIPSSGTTVQAEKAEEFRQLIETTPYGMVLRKSNKAYSSLQDAGLTDTMPGQHGIDLTVDLCPSQKPLTRELFTAIINAFTPEERPVPVSISITGIWMLEHPDDLNWLLNLVSTGQLNITWINHTLHHRYNPSLPLDENFLLEKNTDIDTEVLGNEQMMLEHGLIPSIFFRFPGLVSDAAIFENVSNYGLIVLGSDAWLAKGQIPRQGSIVLVHGNGNEPIGIQDFLKLLSTNNQLIKERKWLLLDINGIH